MYCINCGNKLNDNDKFCEKCGSPTSNNINNNIVNYNYVSEEITPKTSNSNIFSIIGGVLIIGISFILLGSYMLKDNYGDSTYDYSSSNKSSSIKLASNYESGEFILDGYKYTLGDNFSSFYDNGWYYTSENKFLTLDAEEKFNNSIPIELKEDSNTTISAKFINLDDESNLLRKCNVWSIYYTTDSTNPDVSFTLPGGIKYGSTYDDIKSVYGKADYVYTDFSENFTKYQYNDDEQTIFLVLTVNGDGKLYSFVYMDESIGK
jgi:hypothetical protein